MTVLEEIDEIFINSEWTINTYSVRQKHLQLKNCRWRLQILSKETHEIEISRFPRKKEDIFRIIFDDAIVNNPEICVNEEEYKRFLSRYNYDILIETVKSKNDYLL